MYATYTLVFALLLIALSPNLKAYEARVLWPTEYNVVFGDKCNVKLKTDKDRLTILTLSIDGKENVFPSELTRLIGVPHFDTIRILWNGKQDSKYFVVSFKYGKESDKKFGEYPEARFSFGKREWMKLEVKEMISSTSYKFRQIVPPSDKGKEEEEK